MDLTPELLTAAGALLTTAAGAMAVVVREVRKTNPNGKLTRLELKLRRMEKRVSLLVDHVLGDLAPSDADLDAEDEDLDEAA